MKFFLAGLIEAWGRGIWRVDKAFEDAGLVLPIFKESCGGFLVHIPIPEQNDTPQLTPQVKRLILILKQQKMTIGEHTPTSTITPGNNIFFLKKDCVC